MGVNWLSGQTISSPKCLFAVPCPISPGGFVSRQEFASGTTIAKAGRMNIRDHVFVSHRFELRGPRGTRRGGKKGKNEGRNYSSIESRPKARRVEESVKG